MRILRPLLLFLPAVLGLGACREQETRVTASDARSIGLVPTQCPGFPKTAVFADSIRTEGNEAVCEAVATALWALAEEGFVEARALLPDSIPVIVVEVDRFSRSPSRPSFPDSGYAVTLDLLWRTENLLVAWPGLNRAVEITWAPKGMKY